MGSMCAMASIKRMVLDISHHNCDDYPIDWDAVKAAGIYGIVHKATQGNSYTDPWYLRNCPQVYDRSMLWGAYHFINTSDPIAQLNHYLGVVGVDDDTLYALDWEPDQYGDCASEAQARKFVEELDKRIGPNRTVIY